MWVRHTRGTGCGLWPTPRSRELGRTSEGYGRGLAELVEGKEQVKHWPTPQHRDWKGGNTIDTLNKKIEEGRRGHMGCLDNAVNHHQQQSGQLNPDWVAWLMGWPIGWESLEPMKEMIWLDWSVDPADFGGIPRVAVGIKDRVHRLKALGNGQVSLCTAVAWEILNEA